MEVNDLLEPSKLYKSVIKPTHKQNVEEFYDGLVKESKLDIELNRETNRNIKHKNQKIEAEEKSLNKKKTLKGFLTVLIIIGFVAAAVMIFLCFRENAQTGDIVRNIIIAVCSVILSVVFIILIKKKITPAIRELNDIISKLVAERDQLIAEATAQMEPLNSLFDYNMAASLFSKTIPLIQLDPYFDQTKFHMLNEKYGFIGNPEKNITSVFVQSGSILGNPFLVEKNYIQDMHNVTYTGHLTISWTETHTDSEGHRYTETHTETLTAYLEKPAPYYYYETILVYGNDAAEKLSFSREPSDANKMNDKQLQKFIDSYDKKLDKLTQQSIKNGGNFQRLGNNEFEALFNALNRDDNVQFRLLFTPLAQKNMCDLIKSKEPYGDDFEFIKRKNLNYIKSAHSQNTNFESDPNTFAFYDYDVSRAFFIDYNEQYMQSLYYDLAPLMSIPLYQQHAAQEYIYKGMKIRNVTEMETEVMANSFDRADFMPDQAATDAILKTSLVKTIGDSDVNKVHAYSFRTETHITYVSVHGGDGYYHDVPVEWIEYIPVEKTSEFVVQHCQATKKQYDNNYRNGLFNEFLSQFSSNNDMIYKKGFISFLNSKLGSAYSGNELNNIFKKKGDK